MTPFLAKKVSKIGEIVIFLNFDLFLAKRGVKYYPISFLRPDLESSRRGGSVGAIFKVLSTILNFGLKMGVHGGFRGQVHRVCLGVGKWGLFVSNENKHRLF